MALLLFINVSRETFSVFCHFDFIGYIKKCLILQYIHIN